MNLIPTLDFNHEKKESSPLCMIGIVIFGLSLSLIPSLIVSLINNEDAMITLLPIIFGAIVGFTLLSTFKMSEIMRPVTVLVSLAALWITCILYGTIPFLNAGMTFVDGLFESASGFTTTGSTIITDLSEWPKTILFWRCSMNWIGGIIIILIVMLYLPMVGLGAKSVIGNETAGSGSSSISIRLRDAAKQFISIYMLLSISLGLLLIVMGYPPFQAVTLAMSTISTGGFLAANIEFTIGLKLILIVFMFMGGTNFYLHFRAVYMRTLKVYSKNEEFIVTSIWMALMAGLFFFILRDNIDMSIPDTIVDAIFVSVSTTTTTGFIPTNYVLPPMAVMLMFLLAFFGSSSGSTAGGVKISRVIISSKYLSTMAYRVLHPNAVSTLHLDDAPITKEVARSSITIVVMFIFTIIIFTLVLALCGLDSIDSLSSSISAITNLGVGNGTYHDNFHAMDWYVKLMMAFMMWVGRLEIFIALAMLSPRVWKEHILDLKYRYRQRQRDY